METLIILAAFILNIGLGVVYTQHLRIYWPAFYLATNKHASIYVVSTLFWSIIFVVFVTWRTFEPLTKSRKKDWDEI